MRDHSILDNWSEWRSWNTLLDETLTPSWIRALHGSSGVYEVKFKDDDSRLTIGRSDNLRRRIVTALLWRDIPHSSGERISELKRNEDLMIRWASTDNPVDIEIQLHQWHKEVFKELPRCTRRT